MKSKTYLLPYFQTRWCENELFTDKAAKMCHLYCKFNESLASLPNFKQFITNRNILIGFRWYFLNHLYIVIQISCINFVEAQPFS